MHARAAAAAWLWAGGWVGWGGDSRCVCGVSSNSLLLVSSHRASLYVVCLWSGNLVLQTGVWAGVGCLFTCLALFSDGRRLPVDMPHLLQAAAAACCAGGRGVLPWGTPAYGDMPPVEGMLGQLAVYGIFLAVMLGPVGCLWNLSLAVGRAGWHRRQLPAPLCTLTRVLT